MFDQNPVFIPGPTNIPDRLRLAMQLQSRDHRAPDFKELLNPLLADLKKIFKTKTGQIFTFPSSGTGGWEAAITNTLSPGDKVLVARYGMFSHRWIDLCQRHSLDVDVIDIPWGEGAPAKLFEDALKADKAHQYKAVLVTHNETATGVLSDIHAVRKAIDTSGHPTLLFVDCVSSLACMDFKMDEWGVDLAVSGSQKGFMLNTGMAIVGVSKKALASMETAGCSRCFFDFRDMHKANENGGYPYTPPLQLMHGLRESVDMLLEEGLDNVFIRHQRIAEGVRRAVTAWNFELCAKSPELYSNSVTTILTPKGFDGDALVEHAYNAYKVSFGVGLGEMAGKAFRIGHLGSMSDVMALSGIATIEMAMCDLNYPIELGSGVSAAQEYYRTTTENDKRQAA